MTQKAILLRALSAAVFLDRVGALRRVNVLLVARRSGRAVGRRDRRLGEIHTVLFCSCR